ncbi:MAG: SH3 domain-containing protein [Firmicutes bacterium]|nr:SH3 domain-containing protein [Bacillota bacterium]
MLNKRIGKATITVIAALCLVLAAGLLPAGASWAGVRYMPDVTADMSQGDYWARKVGDPDRVQVSMEEIEQLNRDIWKTSQETRDLANWPKTEYDAVACVSSLMSGARSDAVWCYNNGAKYDSDGNVGDKDTLYAPRIANCQDPDVTDEDMETGAVKMRDYKYAVCTTRSALLVFPTEDWLLDDADNSDPDYDLNYLSIVRVNEPLLLRTMSKDGQYYAAMSSGCAGWIKASDVAVCENREEWLAAWNYPSDQLLVVWDDKIYTEDSRFQPETANRKLPMGTCLQLAGEEETQGRISNRTAHNNHVVWMPVRRSDGTYEKKLALIGENRKVSEGYLPLTTRNVMRVAMNQLGDAYGWGGMMGTNDCSGYVRDVYRCFGIDMPRSCNRNNGVAKSWDLSGMSDGEKTAFIKRLPPGTLLAFSGHEMIYLGYEGDKLYVISSVSNVRMPGDTSNTRVRGGVINTLDIWRRDNTTWLHNLNVAEVPYYSSAHPDPQVSIAAAEVTGITGRTYTGEAQTQTPQVRVNGTLLTMDRDYAVTYRNNRAAGTAAMTISGIGAYTDSLDRTFVIDKGENTLQAAGKTVRVSKKKLKKKKKQVIKRARAIRVSGQQGRVTYKKVSVSKKKYAKRFTVNSSTGKITVKKGVKRGVYRVKVRVTAAGNDNVQPKATTVTVTVRVKR